MGTVRSKAYSLEFRELAMRQLHAVKAGWQAA